MFEELNRYREALEKLAVLGGGRSDGNRIAQEALNPRPLTEEVEVKRWGIYRNDGYCNGVFETQHEAGCGARGFPTPRQVIELTGHYTREVPRKVKKRVEIGVIQKGFIGGLKTVVFSAGDELENIPLNAPCFAEWEE